ncbi:MAG: transcription-repair coupling factor [Acholeplasmataceae bacterium]
MNHLAHLFKQFNAFNIKDKHQLSDVSEGYISSLMAYEFLTTNKTIFLVVPSMNLAQLYYDNIASLIGSENVLFYPSDELLTSILSIALESFKIERIYTRGELINNPRKVVILNQAAAVRKTLPLKEWKNATLKFKPGMDIDFNKLSTNLVNYGYKREYTVIKPGEFSIRGSIIDIFPLGSETPYRLDFFDTELEVIKPFDPETQRSIGQSSEITVLPMSELFFDDATKDKVVQKMEHYVESETLSKESQLKFNEDIDNLYQRIDIESLEHHIGFFTSDTIFDFSKHKSIFYLNTHLMKHNEVRMLEDVSNYHEEKHLSQSVPFYVSLNALLNYEHIKLYSIGQDDQSHPVYSRDPIRYQGNDHTFIQTLDNDTYILSIFQESRYLKLIDSLNLAHINYHLNPKKIVKNEVNIFYPSHFIGFSLYEEGVHFIHESDIYDYKTKRSSIKYQSVLSETIKISDVSELSVGDYVVHYDYGIGLYEGIKTMELSGIKRDYIHIAYQGTDYLYIPVDQIDLILKYASREGHTPTLTRLGTNQWSNTKKRIKNKLSDLSDRLLNLYASREEASGFMFLKEDTMHEQFRSYFEYDETPDQMKAIEAVIEDMESSKVMDRLICGDVGYGKTEVAMRASFKAVYSNKQVAYLVPTTVLARQHFHTFKKRFEPFGITVELLSRFVTPTEQKHIIDKLSKGYIDIVIGTHRLLSKDISFKDLGLLVIDEEQRFGVEHKEKIKEMKINVDTLSLSATPIPRTLQMSLVGLKDLSMIETPPLNRYPVQTYIIERHDSIIKEAIERELARGGQVFYLYNRVYDMPLVEKRLKRLVPDARITHAHGKMNRDVLENTISSFIEGQFDVLVSTTIIETGIDIPNTNTLIIHDADRLGLSQLYQIRGRVGRSDKIAYSYMMYDRHKVLSEDAEKRLKTIKDFQALGSGFKIAMRDLAIRGAGDLLGEEQSGFIDSVGLETYLRMLEEVINEKKGIKVDKTVIDDETILSDRHIKESYISNDDVRLEIHKRISSVNTLNDLNNLTIELKDRFGQIDDELMEYMYEKLFRKLSSKLGVEKVNKTKLDLSLQLSVKASKFTDGEKLFSAINKVDSQIKLSYLHERIHITLIFDHTDKHYLYKMIEYLSLIT